MLTTMTVLVEDTMCVSQGEAPMSGGDTMYQWSYEESCITSMSDKLVGTLSCPHQIFYEKLLTPKEGGTFILAIPTNRSHQVISRSLIILCLSVLCTMKPGDKC